MRKSSTPYPPTKMFNGVGVATWGRCWDSPAFHKRCSTIERNTTKMIATVKSVTCPLALCKKPGRLFRSFGIVMGGLPGRHQAICFGKYEAIFIFLLRDKLISWAEG